MATVLSGLIGAAAASIADAAKSCGYALDGAASTMSVSKQFGDISSSAALKIAKREKTAPKAVAEQMAKVMAPISMVEKVTCENGFINLHIDRVAFSKAVIAEVSERTRDSNGKRLLIEYMSVNPNKPWHVGHLRNALIGDALANIYESVGYEVERQDYIEDLGLQMAEIIWWLEKTNATPQQGRKYDFWLGEEYVKANKEIDERKDQSKAEIDEMMGLMSQEGTAESVRLKEIVTKCVKAQYDTAFGYRIYHNLMVWESDIIREQLLEKSIGMMLKKGIARKEVSGEYAGCTVVGIHGIDKNNEMEGLKESVKVLVRSNGMPTYLAKDIAYHMWKTGVLENSFRYSVFMERQPNGQPIYTTSQEGKRMGFGNVDTVVNVIDSRQSQPQSVLRMVFKAIGGKGETADIRHIAYGEVQLETGSISGRKGTWMNGYAADEVLGEAVRRASGLITSRFEMGQEEKDRIAKAVALAAIKYEFLKTGLEKTIIFSLDRAINFEGDTGPYHQYMHARANRVIREAGANADAGSHDGAAVEDAEFDLVKVIAASGEAVAKAARESRPNVIADYMGDLSTAFSRFYEQCPILKAPEGKRAFRVALTRSFRDTSASMLGLLGIEALERM